MWPAASEGEDALGTAGKMSALQSEVPVESLATYQRTRCNSLIPHDIFSVTLITRTRENYHCRVPIEADNEERHWFMLYLRR